MKKRFLACIFLFVFSLFSTSASADLQISPPTSEDLINILKGFADDPSLKEWCESQCAQILVFKMSGKISSGELNLEIQGNIVGKQSGVVPLFGAVPSAEILVLTQGGQEAIPTVFHQGAYYAMLTPGSFHLTGKIRVRTSVPTNITLPAPVGRVVLDLVDQEPLLKFVQAGQIGGSFQLLSTASPVSSSSPATVKKQLRLNVVRSFVIGRDKTFQYDIRVVGAQVGQVVSFPLEHKEKVLNLDPQNAKVSPSKVDFTATASEDEFIMSGEWTQPQIELKAMTGAVKEIWSAECEGGYDCLFDGTVEKSVVSDQHEWLPVSGQNLVISWKELGLMKGNSLVAQKVLLQTEQTAKGVKQTLHLQLTSSAADELYLGLPTDAIPSELAYDDVQSPILKNEKGDVHLSLPQGDSRVVLSWEIPKTSTWSVPLPTIPVFIGQWTHWVSLSKHDLALFAGGLPASPVILYWPHLVFCIFCALFFLFIEKRFLQKFQTGKILLLLVALGYALTGGTSLVVLLILLLTIRLLSRIQKQRTIFGWIFELAWTAVFSICVVVSFIKILHTAFFSDSLIHFNNLCSSSSWLGLSRPYNTLCWDVNLVATDQPARSPFLIVMPSLIFRCIYFGWAVVAGFFFYGESKKMLSALKHYIGLGKRSLVKKK